VSISRGYSAYLDGSVESDVTYYYAVTVVIDTGEESEFSSEVKAISHGHDDSTLSSPKRFMASAPRGVGYIPGTTDLEYDGIYLEWCPNPPSEGITHYNVYRMTETIGALLGQRIYASETPLVTLPAECMDGRHRCEIDDAQPNGYSISTNCARWTSSGRTCRVIDTTVQGATTANEIRYYYVVTAVRDGGTPPDGMPPYEESGFSNENQGWPQYLDLYPDAGLRYDPDNFPVQPCGDPIVLRDADEVLESPNAVQIANAGAIVTGEVRMGNVSIGESLAAPYRAIGAWVGPSQPSADPRFIFYHLDHLGSPRVITDESGNVVSQHHYMPFGEETPLTGVCVSSVCQGGPNNGLACSSDEDCNEPASVNSTNTRHFTGHERDGESGLDYMLARYYNSSLCRLISVDPILSSAILEVPQSWNRYSYAWNNPLLLIDPTGETVVLTGATEENRNAELEAIKHSLHDEEAASQLSIEAIEQEDGSTQYVVVIEGDADAFSSSSPTGETIADAIGSTATIEFGFGKNAYTETHGGAYTQKLDGGNSRITIDPDNLTPEAAGVPQTMDSAIQHEFGHSLGIAAGTYKNRSMKAGTNWEALMAENGARLWYNKVARRKFGEGSVAATAAGRLYPPRQYHGAGF
jgi:RHS repeat-associated protein